MTVVDFVGTLGGNWREMKGNPRYMDSLQVPDKQQCLVGNGKRRVMMENRHLTVLQAGSRGFESLTAHQLLLNCGA